MSKSSDPGHFFQTSYAPPQPQSPSNATDPLLFRRTSLSESNRKSLKSTNTHGDPVTLSSKLLAIHPSPSSPTEFYVALSSGVVVLLSLSTGKTLRTFRGPITPLTSIAVSSSASLPTTLYAGSWDKTIWSWRIPTGEPGLRFRGHTDFVKAVLFVSVAERSTSGERQTRDLLLSASADATIIVWDAVDATRLHVLTGHARGVQTLVLDPFAVDDNDDDDDHVTIFSGGSEREIRRWRINASAAMEMVDEHSERLATMHETSVYALHFDSGGDLWTASADRTAKRAIRERGWAVDTVLEHPDFVRDVLVIEKLGIIVTACRDEDVRVWDQASGELRWVWRGHWEEVTALAVREDGKGCVSVSLDGTVRKWGLTDGDIEQGRRDEEREQKRIGNGGATEDEDQGEDQPDAIKMTAEEESELAELIANE